MARKIGSSDGRKMYDKRGKKGVKRKGKLPPLEMPDWLPGRLAGNMPTDALPGTPMKQVVMYYRACMGWPVCHPLDARLSLA